jgi:hypothetical protein
MTANNDWLNRYRDGEQFDVWQELTRLGGRVRGPKILPHARAVAREAMFRLRGAVERLIESWGAQGFEFGYGWAGEIHRERVAQAPPLLGSPRSEEIAALDRFETQIGPLPVSLRAFYEVVGAVNLVGAAPGLPWPGREELDPLQIVPFGPQLPDLLDGARSLVLCPDFLLKYFIGGVGPIYTRVPSAGFDAVLEFEGAPMKWQGVQPLYFASEGEPICLVPYLREVVLGRGGIGLISRSIDEGLLRRLRP